MYICTGRVSSVLQTKLKGFWLNPLAQFACEHCQFLSEQLTQCCIQTKKPTPTSCLILLQCFHLFTLLAWQMEKICQLFFSLWFVIFSFPPTQFSWIFFRKKNWAFITVELKIGKRFSIFHFPLLEKQLFTCSSLPASQLALFVALALLHCR